MSTPSPALNNLRTFAVTPEASGATLRYLTRHLPDLNPLDMLFSKFKAYLLKLAERTVEIGAVVLCLGNPAYASQIGLVCHPVRETLGAASHCGLFIFSGRKVRAQYSLGPLGTTFNTDAEVTQIDRAAFLNGDVYTVRTPEGETQKGFEKSVVDWANRYKAPYYDVIMGPNSNSAVAFPLIMSGAELPNVQQGVLGAWGLGYWSFLRRDPVAGPTFASAPDAAVARRAQLNACTQCGFADAAGNRGRTRRAGNATPAMRRVLSTL